MKAVIQDAYGPPDVLDVREIGTPVPRNDEVLVRVRAASVHPDVWHVVSGRPYVLRLMGAGLRRPKERVPGTDVAGHAESVGADVTRFRPGDEVFGETSRGNQWRNGGAFAEYVVVPEDALARKPATITFEQAAAIPTSGLIALQNVPPERLRPGQRVLVNGAGGGVGSIVAQLATAYEAAVTGVDSADKLDMIRSLGADHVIDHTREDFTRGDERYDLIVDIPGNRSFSDCRRVLTPNGTYVLIGHDHFGRAGGRWLGSLPHFFAVMARSPFTRHMQTPTSSPPSKKDLLALLAELVEQRKLMPVVDRSFPLDAVPDALRYLAEGHVRGKVVITT